ncbi:MAG: hypothetical protein NTY88_04520 [Bacteroidetes bacterium]|nr:hypothetical protein [Bacteroidota bacterium]
MKHLTNLSAALVLEGILTFNSCKKEDNNPPTGCTKELVIVGATIDAATTWDSCHIYYVSNIFLGLNATLTIQEGTIVKFGPQKGIVVNGGGGRLVVTGTGGHPVIFTSAADDSRGGDTNGDGSATTAQKGDWQFITLGTTSGNSIDHAEILYAGYATATYEQSLNMGGGVNNSVTSTVFAHNAGSFDSKFAALNMSGCPQSSTAKWNIFYDNGHPLIIGTSTDIDDSNTFHNPANATETNLCNGIFVDCVHNQDQADLMTWEETEVAFVLGGWSGNSWAFDATKILTLGDNVVVKFARYTNPGFSILFPDGGLGQIANYDGPGVEFTSYGDDTYKGDTNGDGFSSPDLWSGISYPGINWYQWSNIHYQEH